MNYENPEWVKKINKLIEQAKGERKSKSEVKKKQQIILTPKEEGLLWTEMLKDLASLKKNKEIISFSTVFEKICRKFSITKAKAWNCMFFLVEFGLIEIVRFHGIRLNYKINKCGLG